MPAAAGALRHGSLRRIAAHLECQQSLHRDWVLAEIQVRWIHGGRSFVRQTLRECRLVITRRCRPGWPNQGEPRAHPRVGLDSIFVSETQAGALAVGLLPNMASEYDPSLSAPLQPA